MRNYVEIYTSRVNLSGQHFSFVSGSRDDVIRQTNGFIANNGGTADWNGATGYVLLKKSYVVAILQELANVYPNVWGQSWIFLQDGLIARSSPRVKWSHNH